MEFLKGQMRLLEGPRELKLRYKAVHNFSADILFSLPQKTLDLQRSWFPRTWLVMLILTFFDSEV